jgi:hypothetical protein
MSSLFVMLDEREANARAAAEELRGQVAKLTVQLAAVEDELSRLAITRATALSLGYAEPEEPAPDPTISQPAYLAILAELERAPGGLRAGRLCQILDVGTESKHREGMRSRLKRLAGRGIITETEPGLFVLASTKPKA